jgi:hypothetical protein
MILRNDIVNFCYIGNMAPAGDLLLVAEDALEWASLLRDKYGNSEVLHR